MTLTLIKQRQATLWTRKLTGYVRAGFALMSIAGLAFACTTGGEPGETASSSSSMRQCEDIAFTSTSCDTCVREKCCDALRACAETFNCSACARYSEPGEPNCAAVADVSGPLIECWVRGVCKCECGARYDPECKARSSSSSTGGGGGSSSGTSSSSSGSGSGGSSSSSSSGG